jgi:hypothetical protein
VLCTPATKAACARGAELDQLEAAVVAFFT